MQKRAQRWWDLPAAFFLLSCLMAASIRLGDTKWTQGLGIVATTTLLATILGLALGYSRFKGWIAALIGLGYTITIVPWQLTLQIQAEVAWLERVSSLGGRLWNGVQNFLHNEPLTDPLPFLANMVILFWLISLITGYNMTRHGRPWLGVLIGGAAILIIDIYHPDVGRRGMSMAVFVIFTLLLVTRVYFMSSSHRWEKERISVDSDTGWSLGRGALVTAIVLVFIAWNANTVAKAFSTATPERHQMISIWRGLRQRLENFVAPLRGSNPVPVEYYDDEFSLGTGSTLSNDLVVTVDPSITRRIGINYYWKMRSYNRYLDGKWYSTLEEIKPQTPLSAAIEHGRLYNRLPIRFIFRSYRNLSMLFAPSLPLTISRPVSLIYGKASDSVIDLIAIEIDPMLHAGESYEVFSWVAAPTTAGLKAAGEDYPTWISDNYLQLPITTPESIKNLALEITEGLETPFEKTAAITNWLRENIEYTPAIPSPPADQDVIEWILFTEKKAFCNYYSTAEILMLRSLGIPARWVVGYAQGELNKDKGFYEVRAKDSHSWPEVYFPGYGWIEFEPTSAQPDIERPSGDNASSVVSPFDQTGGAIQNPPLGEPDEEEFERMPDRSELPGKPIISPLAAVISIAVLLVVAVILFFIRQGQRDPQKSFPVLIEKAFNRRGWRTPLLVRQWSSYVRLTPIERAYAKVEWVIRLMGAKISPSSTPAEQKDAMVKALPDAESLGVLLLDEYQKAIYSPYPADLEAARQASSKLVKLALKTRIKMLAEVILSGHPQPKMKPDQNA